MEQSLLKNCAIDLAAAYSAAAQTDVTTSVFDMQGYDGICYIAYLGDVTNTSVLTLTAKENTASSTSSPTPTAITGGATDAFTASASSADDKFLVVDIYRPLKRYQYAVLSRGTANAVVNGIIAIRYRSATKPITQSSTTIASAFALGS